MKKFFALSLARINPIDESKPEQMRALKLPQIREHDLLLAFLRDSPDIKNEHALCVVDSLQGEGNQVIIKIVLNQDIRRLDERNWNVMESLSEGSGWTLLKICSLENFNRSYVGYDQFQICNLH